MKHLLICGTLFIWCMVTSTLQAQVDTIKTERIEVVKEYRPYVEDGKKQSFQPVMPRSTQKQASPLQYQVPQQFVETSYEPDEIRPLPLDTKYSTENKSIYAKLGFGNSKNPLAQVALNTLEEHNYSLGLLANHEGVEGDWADQNMSKTTATAFGNKELSNTSLHGEINYSHALENYYGYDHDDPLVQTTFFESTQFINQFGATVGIESATFRERAITYKVSSQFNSLKQDFFDLKESQIGGMLEVNAPEILNQFSLGLTADVTGRTSKNPSNLNTELHKMQDFVLHATPSIRANFNSIYADLGLSLNSDDENGFKIFPAASIQLPISDDQYLLYLGWNGRTKNNGFMELMDENPWLSSQTEVKNFTKQVITPVGLKGSFSEQFGFNVSINREIIENAPLFVNGDLTNNTNFLIEREFTPIYEEKLSSWKPSLSLNYLFGEMASVLAQVDYNSYSTKTEAKAWHLPKLDAGLSVSITPIEKLEINSGFKAMTGIQARDEMGAAEKLDNMFNLNAGAQYNLNDRFSIFLDGNNLTNSENLRWKNYPSIGTNILAGIVLSY